MMATKRIAMATYSGTAGATIFALELEGGGGDQGALAG